MPTITAREQLPTSAPVEGVKEVAAPVEQAIHETQDSASEAAKREALSPRFAQLARQQKMLRAQQIQFQKEREEFKAQQAAKLAEYESSYIPKSKLNELAKMNPLAALEQMGVSPDEFTQGLLNANPQEALIQKLQARLEELENGQKKAASQLEEQSKQNYEQALTLIRTDMKKMIQTDPRFETVREADAQGWQATEGAVSLVETIFNEGWPEKDLPPRTVISNEEALEYVQEWVKEKAYAMAQLKGVKEKFAPAAPLPSEESEKHLGLVAAQRAPAKTLSNTMNASKTTRLTDKERRERAVLALSGQLS